MRYLWVLINTAVWTTVLGSFGILISFIEPTKGRTLGFCANLWAKLILFFGGIKYSVKGLENLDSNGAYIFAGNHASGFDILLAFAALPYWVVSIAKVELKSVFLLGWVMTAAGHIFVDRGRGEKAIRSLKKAKISLLKTPRSVLLFPEGTRTLDGTLGLFKKGGLMLSLDTEIPIVPVAFSGTFEILEKGSWSIRNKPIEIRIGKPISPSLFSYETRKDLVLHVREEVESLLLNKE